MKRGLADNLAICAVGLCFFWFGNIVYTICKYNFGIETDFTKSMYFICNAMSYVLINYGLLKIAHDSKLLKTLFTMFLFLSIANLLDELTFMATQYDIREYWYSGAIVGFFTAKMIHQLSERN